MDLNVNHKLFLFGYGWIWIHKCRKLYNLLKFSFTDLFFQASIEDQVASFGFNWKWLWNGIEVAGDSEQPPFGPQAVLPTSSSLLRRVNATRLQHEGDYSCLLQTRLETLSSRPVPVQVFEPSRAVVDPARLELLAGGAGRVACRTRVDARLQGAATAAWYRDGRRFEQAETSEEDTSAQVEVGLNKKFLFAFFSRNHFCICVKAAFQYSVSENNKTGAIFLSSANFLGNFNFF